MNSKGRRVGLIFLLLVCLMLATPIVLTWRQYRRDRLNIDLIAAAKRNDDRAVVSLLDQGADANTRDEQKPNLSFWQALMQVVHQRPAQPARPSEAPTALSVAMQLQDGVKIGRVTAYSFPPENVPLVRALLNHGARVNTYDRPHRWLWRYTPLGAALGGGKTATARLLLSHGADVHQPCILFRSADPDEAEVPESGPLNGAVLNPFIDVGLITELLDHGADVNERDRNGRTPLFKAVITDRLDVVRLLLARHADTTIAASDGLTPLDVAMGRRNALLRRNALPPGISKRPPPTKARLEILRLLKAAGAKEYPFQR